MMLIIIVPAHLEPDLEAEAGAVFPDVLEVAGTRHPDTGGQHPGHRHDDSCARYKYFSTPYNVTTKHKIKPRVWGITRKRRRRRRKKKDQEEGGWGRGGGGGGEKKRKRKRRWKRKRKRRRTTHNLSSKQQQQDKKEEREEEDGGLFVGWLVA